MRASAGMQVPGVLTFFLFRILSPQSCILQGRSPEQQLCPEDTEEKQKHRIFNKGEEPHPLWTSELMREMHSLPGELLVCVGGRPQWGE